MEDDLDQCFLSRVVRVLFYTPVLLRPLLLFLAAMGESERERRDEHWPSKTIITTRL